MFSNVSSTINIVFPIRHVKTMLKDYSANINNTLGFVQANVSQKMFPSLPTVGNMTKHRQETMFPPQCCLVCPGLKALMTPVIRPDTLYYGTYGPYFYL